MAIAPAEDAGSSPTQSRSWVIRFIVWALSGIPVVYALLAGLHTLQDFDLGWQLATGRWVLEHHRVFSTDVFSYTASGQPWVYPALSGLIFYLTYLAGGYALLSWLGALASAATVGLVLHRDNLARTALALVAVPLIVNRSQPRAEMFTTILFAAFLVLLWRHYRRGRAWLGLLPLLMVLWVNLHPGFIAGLGLCAGYLLLEACDLAFPSRRKDAAARLRRAAPWFGLTALATLVNPWGVFVYRALLRQQQAQALHNLWVVEWAKVPLSWASLQQGMDWRDPQSSFWWLLAILVVCVAFALWRRQWGAAALLAGSAYVGLQHIRMQALFACVVVVIGGDVLCDGWPPVLEVVENRRQSSPSRGDFRLRRTGVFLLAAVLTCFAGFRCWDLISNRYYMRSVVWSEFGSGLSWWFPERAADFLQREKLPANVFHGYSLGGYLTWRLFPAYRDYIDGRALPFGSELYFRAYDLSTEPPDSDAWQQEAQARGINTVIVPLSRYQGMSLFPQLQAFCRSKSWRPVYLDEVSAIFVRVTPETVELVDRLAIDCNKVTFAPPNHASEAQTARARADLFNFYANAGGVLYSLERYVEAIASLDRAQSICQDNASVHLLRALVLEQTGKPDEAENEFRTSLSLDPSDEAWFDLGLFYMTQRRYADAAEVLRKSAAVSARPHDMWLTLGLAYLQMHEPHPALEALDKAEAASPFGDAGAALGSAFDSLIATGRSKAWYQLGDVERAVSYQEEAVKLAPNDPKLWSGLADLYEVQGRTTKAAEARSHAAAIGH